MIKADWLAKSGCLSYYFVRGHQEYIPEKGHYFEGKLTIKHPVFCSHCHTKITVNRRGDLKYEHSEKLLTAQLRRELGE